MRALGQDRQHTDLVPRGGWTGGEVLALRSWRLGWWDGARSVVLGSLVQGNVWEGPVFRADRKPLDGPGGHSGVYALKPGWRPRMAHFLVGGAEADWLTGPDAWVWGWVALSGQVVEHEYGYRAERAVVRRLHLGVRAHAACESPSDVARIVRDLERRYQCEVRRGYWESREAARQRFAASITGAAVPKMERVAPAPRAAAPATPVARVRPAGAEPRTSAQELLRALAWLGRRVEWAAGLLLDIVAVLVERLGSCANETGPSIERTRT